MMVLCRCIHCERTRMGQQNYTPRFYLNHHEFIKTTVTINENCENTTEIQFSIYGDPLPITRNVYHDQYYSIEEIDLFQCCLTDLIVGHIFVPFLPEQEIEVEVFFHLKDNDCNIPEDAIQSLSEELVQAMTGFIYTDMRQVQQTLSYKAMSESQEGMIMIVVKNEISELADGDFDDEDV